MRLFKMEIYKLYHEKDFFMGSSFCNRVNDDTFFGSQKLGMSLQ